MNRSQLEDAFKDFMQTDFSAGQPWTQAECDRYLRIAEMQMFTMVAEMHEDFFRTNSQLSETIDVATINLPVNCYRILKLERIVGLGSTTRNPIPLVKLQRNTDEEAIGRGYYLNLQQAPINPGAAYPMHYYHHGQKKVELFPTPTQSNTNSLLLTYIYRPAEMVAGSDVPFQETAGSGGAGKDSLEEFHDILWLYAAEMALQKEENSPLLPWVRGEREKRESQLRTYLAKMNVQGPRYIRVPVEEMME